MLFWARIIGLVAGPCLALICAYWLPTEFQDSDGSLLTFSLAGRTTLAIMVWMAVWWLTEAIDISATALLPVVAFPLLNVASLEQTTRPYAHPVIFLFLGGFLLALSLKRWGLDRRIALLTLRCVGTKPTNMIAGFMLVTAFLSAFVSNTATAAMMLPIAMSVVAMAGRNRDDSEFPIQLKSGIESEIDSGIENEIDSEINSEKVTSKTNPPVDNFAIGMMLGIAYGASIGGISTIIGTPPNVFLVSFLRDSIAEPYRMELGFAQWLLIGVPLAAVFLPLVWLLLTRVIFPTENVELVGGREWIADQIRQLGPINRGEWTTLLVFSATAIAWITRPWLTGIEISFGGQSLTPLAGLSDSVIAMTGALILFVIPVGIKPLQMVMDWDSAKELPWGILILFGGGLSLASAISANGVAEFFGSQARFVAGVPDILLVLIVCTGVVFLTELTSNTATAATLLPVLAALAPGLGVHPYLLVFPTAIAASCAFMLPVATPPNAIVFASGQVTIGQMVKAGFWLNLIAVVLATLLTFLIIAPLLGI